LRVFWDTVYTKLDEDDTKQTRVSCTDFWKAAVFIYLLHNMFIRNYFVIICDDDDNDYVIIKL